MDAIQNVPSFMEDILRSILFEQNYKINQIRYEKGCSEKEGHISILYRAIISVIDSKSISTTLSFICKFEPNHEIRKNLETSRLFNREVFVYTKVLPEFDKIQKEYNIPKDEVITYPKCYYANFDDVNDVSLIILEDLSTQKFQLNKTKLQILRKSELILIELAHFNAISFALKYYKPEVFENFKNMIDLLAKTMQTNTMKPINNQFCELAVSIVNLEEENLKEKLIEIKDTVWDEMDRILDGTISEPFSVVNHGDCWINNFLFQHKNNQPTKVALLDFQHSRYASPVIDIVYYLFFCVDEEFRKDYYDYCLELYYNEIIRYLSKFNITNPQSLFPRSVFEEHLIKFGRIGLGIGIFSSPIVLDYPFEGDEELEENKIKIKAYKKRMIGVFKDIQRFKYFFD